MKTGAFESVIVVGPWQASRASGELRSDSSSVWLEPKVMDLLFLLASRPQEVISKEEISARLWPDVIVGDDTLARTISKLRKALGDNSKSPRFIETIPKRGYRLIENVREPKLAASPITAASRSMFPRLRWAAAVLGAAMLALGGWSLSPISRSAEEAQVLTERADDFYMQFTRGQNEAAIDLYERTIATNPTYARAYAGLANSLVQRVIRWPSPACSVKHRDLGQALRHGHTRSATSQRYLARAQQLAETAVLLAPHDAAAHKALGFVYGARQDFQRALASHRRAANLDPDAWAPLVNIADILQILDRPDEALAYLESAFTVMSRLRETEKTHVLRWYAPFAVGIGERYELKGQFGVAEQWYRRALDYAPLDRVATSQLAKLLSASGDRDAAARLCRELAERVGADQECISHPDSGDMKIERSVGG